MKTKYSRRGIKTSGYQSQNYYDSFLSDLDVSSLKFLKYKYNKDIKEFTLTNDLNNENNQELYKRILQRKKMIDTELENRNVLLVHYRDEYFDPQTGLVFDEDGNSVYALTYSEDENAYLYYKQNGESSLEFQENDDESEISVEPIIIGNKIVEYKVGESKRNKEDIYKDWNYWDETTEN